MTDLTNRILTIGEDCKSYATEKKARAKAAELLTPYVAEYADQAMICKTLEGRYTIIFKMDLSKGGYFCRYSQHGFMSI